PLPKFLKDLFNNIVIETPKVVEKKYGFFISGSISIYGKKTFAVIKVKKKEEGGYSYSLFIKLPKTWKLTDTFKFLKHNKKNVPQIDLIQIKNAAFVLSDSDYEDDRWGNIVQGLNVIGTVQFAGVLKKLDQMFGGLLSKLQPTIHGSIKLPEIIGSTFEVDIPFGHTIIKDFLLLAPAKLIIRLEEHTSKIPIPTVTVKGGLIVRIPSKILVDRKKLIAALKKAKTKGLKVAIKKEKEIDFNLILKDINANVNALIKER
ncbi:unnamed protein product, partial [marine sediment metagenome]